MKDRASKVLPRPHGFSGDHGASAYCTYPKSTGTFWKVRSWRQADKVLQPPRFRCSSSRGMISTKLHGMAIVELRLQDAVPGAPAGAGRAGQHEDEGGVDFPGRRSNNWLSCLSRFAMLRSGQRSMRAPPTGRTHGRTDRHSEHINKSLANGGAAHTRRPHMAQLVRLDSHTEGAGSTPRQNSGSGTKRSDFHHWRRNQLAKCVGRQG